MKRRLAPLVVAVAAAVVAALVATEDGQQRRVTLHLPTTGGLRDGSEVRVAGATIGKVDELGLGPGDVVEVELELAPGDEGVGRDATAQVKANNLLGEKYVQLTRGTTRADADEVVRIPRSRVSFPVDLDEVLNVLDAPTRARLAILINEAGAALAGRGVDLNELLAAAPPSFENLRALLAEVNADNAALGRLIETTDDVLTTLTPARADLGDFIDAAGETMRTVAARRQALAQTLDRAPATLRSARLVLADLRQAAAPIEPAAQVLSSTAPALRRTLGSVEPFARAATPTLRKVVTTAPVLTRLGREVTPVAREAVAPLRSLQRLGEDAPPLTKALNSGIDGLLAALQGWARAIQGRDEVGHVFRGHLGFGAEAMTSLMRKLAPSSASRTTRSGRQPRAPKSQDPAPAMGPDAAAPEPQRPAPAPSDGVPATPLDDLLHDLPGLLHPQRSPVPGLVDRRKRGDAPAEADPGAAALLDLLLG